MSPRQPSSAALRKGGLVLVLAVALLPFGVPRWLNGDDAPAGSRSDAHVANLCRDHGGTPTAALGARTAATAQRFCTVRYGRRVYVMDAITPDGFDEDTARFQRQGCEEARRQQRASTPRGHRRESFIYHAKTGICERRS